jgi:hypothetical protein
MSSFFCKCHQRLRISGEIPNPIEWLIISDTAYDGFAGLIDAENLYHAFKHMLKCPNCGRLWVYWDGFEGEAKCYELSD